MSWEGFKPVPIERTGGLVTNYSNDKLPLGVSPDCRNVRFTMNSVATRYGLVKAIATGLNQRITGAGVLVRGTNATPYIPILFHDNGALHVESVLGSGQTTAINPTLVTLQANAYMQMAAHFQRLYMVHGDLKQGLGDPCVFNGTTVEPWSMRPIGEKWAATTAYKVGEIIAPTTRNGHIYQCTIAGTTGAIEPTWLTTDHAVVVDGGVTWQEANIFAGTVLPSPPVPALTRIPAAGTLAAGKDIYVRVTLTNGNGESLYSGKAVLTNTSLNDQLIVTSPTIPSFLSALIAPAAITGYKVYAGQVATAGAEPLYALQGSATIGTPFTINTIAAGAQPPAAATAFIAAAGNVASGVRYGVVLFVNNNDYISGCTSAAIFNVSIQDDVHQLYLSNVPTGPANTKQRIIAIGPSANADGGPFFYIPDNDLDAGIPITSFLLADNVTTTATLNFTEEHLRNSTDVTDYLRKVKLQPQADVQYNSMTHRLACCGEVGQPSMIRWSEPDDPETFYGDNGMTYVSRDDGQWCVTTREYKGETYVFKTRSAFTVQPDDGPPRAWPVIPRWTKYGVPGARAVDVGAEFIAFANRSGAFIYSGDTPVCITDEIADLWRQINWTYEEKIVVHVDDVAKEIRFCVPYMDATDVSHTFTCNYARGTDMPVHFSAFVGKEISTAEARKWSLDDIKANQILRMERPITTVTDPVSQKTQLMVVSPDSDGMVHMIVPGQYSDNGAGINSYYDFASASAGDTMNRFGGFSMKIKGQGIASTEIIPYSGDRIPFDRLIELESDPANYVRRQSSKMGRQFGVRVSNLATAGCYFEIADVNIYLQPVYPY